ncbi:Retinoblastoma-binding protein [Ooceraea biroi]|uniref:Retinoblastoma-binding protein n=1 Tax=Ooceraea biroi TaxID=2015173 RepID=A0A026VXJ9_OOCBI|nr:Retinoblastoma-binding protein [Ooceraea biroi]
MNLELLESFGQNYPEEFDGTLDCISLAVTCTFNKRGTLLAVGCNDGRIVIWDFLTRGIAKIISAHVHPVCSLSWSRNGHKLLSASTDNNVCIWDVLSGECDQKYRFPSPILKVQFHPRNLNKFLVCPMRHAAVMVDVEGTHKVIPLDEDSDLNIVASFDRRGDYVYTGNARGRVLVLDAETLIVKASYKISQGTASNTAVKSIEFARRGSCFLVNTSDRVIRVYDSTEILTCGKNGEPEPIQKLQDLVNKTMWKKCCFSGDGEYVCAGSARQHALYVWEKSIGNLVKILHGTKGELLLDVVWHPVRPIIASISSGVVSIWAQNQVENWSAFAPDFKELDENVEYEERESEFDLSDEDKSVVQGEEAQDEEIEVDVASIDRVAAFCSSDEETEDIGSLQFLPISPDVEDSEDNQVTPHEPPMKKHRSHDINLQGAPTDVASFDRRGDYVYTGNARGRVLVLDAETLIVKASYKISQGTASNTAVKSIEFARRGSCFLVNTSDRVIRVYDSTEILTCGKNGEPEPIQKLQDLVNKTMWKKCCFSGDGEYVCAGSARQHALYVWEKSIGNLVKILHGTKGELLLDVVWHPVRPIIASISSGVVSIWAQNQVENWSAFAPDFKELDENVEYEERESEFDLSDEDKSVVQGEEAQDEEIEVDVASIDRVAAFCSSDEETEDIGSLQFLPISPDVEDSEDNQVTPHEPPMKKHRSHDINLQGAPTDETHPLLNKGKDKPTTKKGRPRLEHRKGK